MSIQTWYFWLIFIKLFVSSQYFECLLLRTWFQGFPLCTQCTFWDMLRFIKMLWAVYSKHTLHQIIQQIMYVSKYVRKDIKNLLQVRLELTASASHTVYKYGALTDCATGASWLYWLFWQNTVLLFMYIMNG